jgi:alkyl hydroperoxide reductase subunit F
MDTPEFILDLSSLSEAKTPEEEVIYDLLILGGGPAAMTSAIYAARKMLNLAMITKDFGGQVRETTVVENWIGFQTVDAKELSAMFEEHVKSFDIPVSLGAGVVKVSKDGEIIKAHLDDGKIFSGRTAIISLGMRHRSLNVPGEKELAGKGVAYCATCDAPLFKDKKVVVAGGGNSAFTTAIDLLKVGARVTLVNFGKGWNADATLRQRVSANADLFDYHQILAISGRDKVEAVLLMDRDAGQEKKISADGIFIEIGQSANSEPVKDLLELSANGEIAIDCSCRTSQEGIFAAGDITTVPFKQIIISAGEGAKAALSAYEYLMQKGNL